MRIAILSDIHGNSVALDAVLADIAAQVGADAYWLLGDLAAMGPDPIGVMQRLHSLPNTRYLRGNTDRWLTDIHKELPLPAASDLLNQINNLPALLTLRYGMVWTQGALTAHDYFDWFKALPLDFRETLPDGTRILCVHAAPGYDDGVGIRPVMSDAEVAQAINGCNADLVFVGHTHWALDRVVAGVRVINLGSVSLQPKPDLRASYVMLETSAQAHRLWHCKVDYDHAAVIEMARTVQHPALAIISAYMLGQRNPVWE